MKKSQNLNLILISVWLVSISVITFYGCSKDSSFSNENDEYLEYLELERYDNSEFISNEDEEIISQAIIRMGVHLENGFYVMTPSCGSDVNISEELYYFIKKRFDHTNIIRSLGIPRTKSFDPEPPDPNCVPHAIANMGKDAPGLISAMNACTDKDPDWKTTGGVELSKVYSVIDVFTNVEDFSSMSINKDTTFNKCVIVIPTSVSNNGHAVNAINYKKSTGLVKYFDYSVSPYEIGYENRSNLLGYYPFK